MKINNKINERINCLRSYLQKQKLDGYIQPRADSFLGEYVPKNDERLQWISGFSGSAGEILILMNKVILFTDSRYTIQATNETKNTNIEVVITSKTSIQNWLKINIKNKIKISIDPWLYSYSNLKNYIHFGLNNNIQFIILKKNPIDIFWKHNRNKPNSAINKHPLKYSGVSTQKKIHDLCQNMTKNKVDAYVVSQTDSLAWLLNIRGADLKHTPIILARAIIFKNKKIFLFINRNRLKLSIIQYIKNQTNGLKIFQENKILNKIKEISKLNKKIWIDPMTTPFVIAQTILNKKNNMYNNNCPIEIQKSIKNSTEIKGSITAHEKDGVALCNFLYWLQSTENNKLNEISAANKIDSLRKKQKNFICTSFETISGFASNGAIVHYRVSDKTNKNFTKNNIYLCDSGGQYLEGTTDVTRAIIIGKPSKLMKKEFTIVLKSHIALASAKFPQGTAGNDLDIIARNPLWKNYMNYGHGTGHGVGSCLSVHEGPHRISKGSLIPLQPGMITSNEPGFYKKNKYGIRIENLMVILKDKNYKNNNLLYFKTLTLAPIDKNLIDYALLNKEETEWINNYNLNVYKNIANKVTLKVKNWLKIICKPHK